MWFMPTVEDRLNLNVNTTMKWSRMKQKRDTATGKEVSKRVRRGIAPVEEVRLDTFLKWHPTLEVYLTNYFNAQKEKDTSAVG